MSSLALTSGWYYICTSYCTPDTRQKSDGQEDCLEIILLNDLSNSFSSINNVRVVMLYFYMNTVSTKQQVELELTRILESKIVDSILFLFSHFYFLFHFISILNLELGTSIISHIGHKLYNTVTSHDHMITYHRRVQKIPEQ